MQSNKKLNSQSQREHSDPNWYHTTSIENNCQIQKAKSQNVMHLKYHHTHILLTVSLIKFEFGRNSLINGKIHCARYKAVTIKRTEIEMWQIFHRCNKKQPKTFSRYLTRPITFLKSRHKNQEECLNFY